MPKLDVLSTLLQLLLCCHAAAAAVTPVPPLNPRLVLSLLAGSATPLCDEAGMHVDELLSLFSCHSLYVTLPCTVLHRGQNTKPPQPLAQLAAPAGSFTIRVQHTPGWLPSGLERAV